MAKIHPFAAIRPAEEKASRIAALPYDVYNSAEARIEVEKEPLSFLCIDRPETQFPVGQDMYAPEVYKKAHDILWQMVENGDFIKDDAPCYYVYELTMNGRTQTGIVACASIDDYVSGVIKKHENTREEKEQDRIRHVDTCNAQTGPIFLAYRTNETINQIVNAKKAEQPVYDFTAPDQVTHRVWVIRDAASVDAIRDAFDAIRAIYIADGHHRCASAVKVGLKRRAEHPEYDGTEAFNEFLSVLFPDDQLHIMDYNRAVKDLNGMSASEFLEKLSAICDVTESTDGDHHPAQKGLFSMFLDGKWYKCAFFAADRNPDPVEGLDVSLLQKLVLNPLLDIQDPRTDARIDFIGGIRGLSELEKRCSEDCAVAFAMYPTSIGELFDVADAGLLMPPKSTWFEPKLRSGLFIHEI